jgi:uncharacterized protein YerC
MALTITDMVQKIAEFTGLPSLVVEVGFLLLMTAFLLIFALIVLAILKSAKTLSQMEKTADYIAGLLTRRYKEIQASEGRFDFRADEWQDETKYIVLEMLKKGKSYKEIKERVDVSRGYVDLVERVATKRGMLLKK